MRQVDSKKESEKSTTGTVLETPFHVSGLLGSVLGCRNIKLRPTFLPAIPLTYESTFACNFCDLFRREERIFFKVKAKSPLLGFVLRDLSLSKLRRTLVKPGGRSQHHVKLVISEDLQDGKTTQCDLSRLTAALRVHFSKRNGRFFTKMDT